MSKKLKWRTKMCIYNTLSFYYNKDKLSGRFAGNGTE